MYLALVTSSLQDLIKLSIEFGISTSSKSKDIQISASFGISFNDSFLATSNLQGLISFTSTLTPNSFNTLTVFSVEPVSKTQI